ncbi:MAG: hypothetical protein QM766_16665 [Burkholderiaceae bacterium]
MTHPPDPSSAPVLTPSAVAKVQEQVAQANKELELLRGLLHDAFEQLIAHFMQGQGRAVAAVDADALLAETAYTMSAFQVQDISDQTVVHIAKRLKLIEQVMQRGSAESGSDLFADPACPVAGKTLDFGSVELF